MPWLILGVPSGIIAEHAFGAEVGDGLCSLVSFLVLYAYQGSFMTAPSWQGAAPGRRAVRIRVVTAGSGLPSHRAVLVRVLPAAVRWALLPDGADWWHPATMGVLCLGLADVLRRYRNELRQTLHDRLAGTDVVRERLVC